MINTSASGNVTVTFTKEEWTALLDLAAQKTYPESCGLAPSAERFDPQNSFRNHPHAAYTSGATDGKIEIARQIVGESA